MSPLDERPLRSVASDPNEVALEVNGSYYVGWKNMRVSRALDAVAGSFEFATTIRQPWPIRPGSEVRVWIGDLVVATGYVDGLKVQLGREGHELSVEGRDRTADLVDCSIGEDLDQARDVGLEDIVKATCEPYAIEVKVLIDTRVEPVWRWNAGETAWTAINRAVKQWHKIAYTDEQGRLIVTNPGDVRSSTQIHERDFKEAELRWEQVDRFRTYIVRGQGRGSDDAYGDDVASVQGLVRDTAIARERTLIILPQNPVDTESAQAIAMWEASVRAARSAGLRVKLRGWRRGARSGTGGSLWALNEIVHVAVPAWRFEAELLVDKVTFDLSPQDGTTTELNLVRADAYAAEPQLDKEGDAFASWGEED